MKAAVKILHHSLAMEAEHPVVMAKGAESVLQIQRDVFELLTRLEACNAQSRRGRISAAGWSITFVDGLDIENLCGVRADVMFIRRSDWTVEEVDIHVKPFLCGSRPLTLYRLEQRLIGEGLMTETECWQSRLSIDDILIDLDLYA